MTEDDDSVIDVTPVKKPKPVNEIVKLDNPEINKMYTRSDGKKANVRYSDDVKVKALALHRLGKSQEYICKALDVHSRGTIWNWVNLHDVDEYAVSAVCDQIRNQESKRLQIAADRMLSAAMTDEKIEKASLSQLMVGYGIAYDKRRLSDGESTENISVMFNKASEIAGTKDSSTSELAALQSEIDDLESQILDDL